ncbi:MAG TPA: hypothetical protein VM890_05255 [Longimicrobium sp.]|jgi:hypothetical protein|nr:hypothetical protein [Longimicrobium sp.]
MDRHARWRFVLGEVAITTVGILIAVVVNAWWQNHQDRRTELDALREMRAALAVDLDDLREDLSRYRRVDRSTRLLLGRLQRGLPYEPGLDTVFGAQLSYRRHLSNSTAYESLRSRGLGLIADDSLRLAVIDFYGLQNSTVALWNEIDTRLVDDDIRPFFRTRFRLRAATPATARAAVPVDYPALARDPAFASLLTTRQETMVATIRSYEHAIAQGERLVALLDRRIARLR